jgi:hypothetical protein
MKRSMLIAFLIALIALVAVAAVGESATAKTVPYGGAPKVAD